MDQGERDLRVAAATCGLVGVVQAGVGAALLRQGPSQTFGAGVALVAAAVVLYGSLPVRRWWKGRLPVR